MGSAKFVVKDYKVSGVKFDQFGELCDFTFAEVSGVVGFVAALHHSTDDDCAGGFGEALDFIQRRYIHRVRRQHNPDDDCDFLFNLLAAFAIFHGSFFV